MLDGGIALGAITPGAAFEATSGALRTDLSPYVSKELGIGSVPMSACLDSIAAAPAVPAATPRTAGN